jgi:mono/diheme cytochrome c family protein
MRALKVLGISIGLIVIVILCAVVYVKAFLPDTGPAPDIKVDITPERLERGKYLANHVTLCMDCHSTRDWSLYAGPMLQENLGGGGEIFSKDMGFPGDFYARNITPHNLGTWTDGEILKAITTGVNKEGKALFPLMGYPRFGKMDKEDIYSIIAYIRTLKPVATEIPPSNPEFPVSFLLNTMPAPAQFSTIPDTNDVVKYGGYMINAAGCVECHSKTDKGNIIPGTEFGGGMEFKQPAGVARSANITFDKETGIGSWTKETFIKRFKSYTDSSYVPQKLGPDDVNTPMPWVMYGGMKESDLAAIYEYLRTVQPIRNPVVKIEKRKFKS